jgi:hypothetical protein
MLQIILSCSNTYLPTTLCMYQILQLASLLCLLLKNKITKTFVLNKRCIIIISKDMQAVRSWLPITITLVWTQVKQCAIWDGYSGTRVGFLKVIQFPWLPLWSSGQSSWLQIQRSGFDSQGFKIFWEVVGLEQGPLSLVSTIEVLLGRESRSSGPENRDYGHRGSAALTTWHPSIRQSWH